MTFKELLDVAKEQLQGLSTLQNPDFRLEQVEHKKDKDVWEIVVSYLVENTNKRVAAAANGISTLPVFQYQYHRIYKRLEINKEREIEGLYIYSNEP